MHSAECSVPRDGNMELMTWTENLLDYEVATRLWRRRDGVVHASLVCMYLEYLGHEHASIQTDTFPKHKERLGKRIKKSTMYSSPLYIETRHTHRTIEISASYWR